MIEMIYNLPFLNPHDEAMQCNPYPISEVFYISVALVNTPVTILDAVIILRVKIEGSTIVIISDNIIIMEFILVC